MIKEDEFLEDRISIDLSHIITGFDHLQLQFWKYQTKGGNIAPIDNRIKEVSSPVIEKPIHSAHWVRFVFKQK